MKRLVLLFSLLVFGTKIHGDCRKWTISYSFVDGGVALSTKNDNAPKKLQQRQIEEGVYLFIYLFGGGVSNLVG